MKYYLREVIEEINSGAEGPVSMLTEIRKSVPTEVVHQAWSSAILSLFMEVGDTAYNRDGYHNTVKLVENYLLSK